MPYILVFDDSRRDLDYLAKSLNENFSIYHIAAYESEEEFLKDKSIPSYDEIHLVIADAILNPRYTGWDILARFKKNWPHVKRVLISNKVTTENMEEAINKCTPDGFIFKR